MSAAVGVLMLVLIMALGMAKARSQRHLNAAVKGLLWGCVVGAWLGASFYLIAGGAA